MLCSSLLDRFKSSHLLKNLSWIVIGNFSHAIFSFLLKIYSARCFSVSEYGIVNYSLSIISFVSSICTLGINSIITKKFVDNEKESGKYIGTSIAVQSLVSVFAIAALIIFVDLTNQSDSLTKAVVAVHSISILFSVLNIFVYWFRYKYRASLVEIIRMIAFAVSGLFQVFSIVVWKNIVLFTIGIVLETAIFGIVLFGYYIKENGFNLRVSTEKAKELLTLSYPFIFSSILVSIYAQIDKIMLKSMIGNDAVAMYSASLNIANVICILLAAVVEAFRPEIMRFKLRNENIYQLRIKQLYCIIFWASVLYGVFVTCFQPTVINILYGQKYEGISDCLSWIVWYSSFSYFGAVTNIFLVVEKRTKWVQVFSLAGAVSNMLLNQMLIPYLGAAGAAIASLCTQIITNVIMPFVVPASRQAVSLMFKGITLSFLFTTRKNKMCEK